MSGSITYLDLIQAEPMGDLGSKHHVPSSREPIFGFATEAQQNTITQGGAEMEHEVTLGDVLKGTKADYSLGPAILFIVSRDTNEVLEICMIQHGGGVSTAQWRSHLSPQALEYWGPCSNADFESRLIEENELWVLDWSSLSDEPAALEEDLDWEIEPVQMWVKGEKVMLEHIQPKSAFIGFANAYPVKEIFHFLG